MNHRHGSSKPYKLSGFYIIFNAFANQVQVKGNTRMQTPPITWYNPKNATTEIKKSSQYKPLDFFVLSI